MEAHLPRSDAAAGTVRPWLCTCLAATLVPELSGPVLILRQPSRPALRSKAASWTTHARVRGKEADLTTCPTQAQCCLRKVASHISPTTFWRMSFAMCLISGRTRGSYQPKGVRSPKTQTTRVTCWTLNFCKRLCEGARQDQIQRRTLVTTLLNRESLMPMEADLLTRRGLLAMNAEIARLHRAPACISSLAQTLRGNPRN